MKGLWQCFGLLALWPAFSLGKVDFLEREKLEFQIVVKYSLGAKMQIESMGLRGNGLGLSWEATSLMTQESEDTWTSHIMFRSSRFGYACDNCADLVPNLNTGDKFQFRAVATDKDGREHVMMGPAYQIPLPMSRVGQHFSEKPVHTFYPFFFQKYGQLSSINITAENDSIIGQREIYFYMPPGYFENPRPAYDVMYMFDFGPILGPDMSKDIIDMFNEAFSNYAADAAVIGFGHYKEQPGSPVGNDRDIIAPYPGQLLTCKEGSSSILNRCNGCLPWSAYGNITQFNELMAKECGKPYDYGGKLDNVLDYLLDEVQPVLSNTIMEENGSVLTREREHTMINGYSWGGIAACYAAWTRPEVFGRAACQSPSMQEPATFDADLLKVGYGFQFINETLRTRTEDRPRQQIVLDVGEEECLGEYCLLLRPVTEAATILRENKDFEEDVNFWFHVYHGEKHSMKSCINRMWNVLKIFSMGRN